MPQDPRRSYQERLTAFTADLASARKASNQVSNARLWVFLAALAGFLWFVFRNDAIPALLILVVGTAAFVVLMARHEKILAREKRSAQLAGINEAGLQRLEGQWTRFPVDGREFADDAHPYGSDLDLFGSSSLFQWLNAAQTHFGRLKLRRLLTEPPRPLDLITADQEMVKELATRLDWRQRFQAAGRYPPAPQAKEDPEALLLWAEDTAEIFPQPALASALRFLPLFSLAFALFSFFQLHSTALMVPPFLLNLALSSRNQRKYGPILDAIGRQKENLATYLDLLRLIEGAGISQEPGEEGFNGTALRNLARNLRNTSGTVASEAVRRLQSMADAMETRRNPILSFLVNSLVLWDLQWLWVFRRWRRENGPSLRPWLETIARFESFASLAIPAFENPAWTFPEVSGFSQTGPLVEARMMAHPLIPAGIRVGNDLRLGRPGEVLIITGSNMSGKSTLMRTLGINLVLAFAGAPVCAQGFRCMPVDLRTSMRLRDDLEKRISSFYAELLRIKGIVEAARNGNQVLFLIDEIFRGTNSQDRHQGAMAVLRQLHDLGSAGLVSTHDLELARLEEIDPAHFRNQHFQESYADGKISFDYRIMPGVSHTTNAIHLLRMVGLGE